MIVPVQALQEGCIVKTDIYSLAPTPLIKSHTVLKETHLAFLKAFSIKEIDIEYALADGDSFHPADLSEVEPDADEVNPSFFYRYNEAVRVFKRHFESWQAGMPVAVYELRTVMVPLFEGVIQNPDQLLTLHEYSFTKDYRYHHAVSVGLIAAALAHKMQYDKKEWIQIGLAGLLADIGMAKISPGILDKSGPLTELEYDEIKKHPVYSYKMIKEAKGLTVAVQLAILQHHERADSEGYPFGIEKSKLHPYSEIIAVADVYHAMSSERQYRAKHSIYYILEEMRRQTFGPLNIPGVLALTDLLLQFSVGATVRLNTEEVGDIVFITPQDLTRPMIKLAKSGDIINLQQSLQLYIEEILNWNKKMLV